MPICKIQSWEQNAFQRLGRPASTDTRVSTKSNCSHARRKYAFPLRRLTVAVSNMTHKSLLIPRNERSLLTAP
jgi:hypothetical protein